MFACSSNAPENLISEEKMESIIFDIMILNASVSYTHLRAHETLRLSRMPSSA